MSKIKIALLQMLSHADDQAANMQKGDEYCRQARQQGADIAVFPEMWNIGYTPFNQDILHQEFRPEHVTRYAENIKKWQSKAISLDSDFVQHYRRLAKELNMAIVITFLEKRSGPPRNAASLIDRHGDIQFTYGKVHTCDFSAEAVCAPGDKFHVCDLDTEKGNIKVGIMICFDREFPESARILMLKGAEIILTPNACEMEDNRIAQFKTRSYENMVGVALANYAYPQNNGHSCAFDGMAFNRDESSRDTCVVMGDQHEGILFAEFDMHQLREWRQREVWGNAYRKPGQYQLLTSQEALPPFDRGNARR